MKLLKTSEYNGLHQQIAAYRSEVMRLERHLNDKCEECGTLNRTVNELHREIEREKARTEKYRADLKRKEELFQREKHDATTLRLKLIDMGRRLQKYEKEDA